MLHTLLPYSCIALAWLTWGGLTVATTPRLTTRVFRPDAQLLGLSPRQVVTLTVLGGSILWPVTAALLLANLLRERP